MNKLVKNMNKFVAQIVCANNVDDVLRVRKSAYAFINELESDPCEYGEDYLRGLKYIIDDYSKNYARLFFNSKDWDAFKREMGW